MSSRSQSRKASEGRRRKTAGNPVIVRAARALGTVLGTVVGGVKPAVSRLEAAGSTPDLVGKAAAKRTRKPSRGQAKKGSSKPAAAKAQRKKRAAGR